MGKPLAKQYDLFLLTINGKGYRLARDLAIGGRRVAWIDVSPHTNYTAKDLAGPFCTALPAEIGDRDRREFFQDSDLIELSQGFTLWHQDGVLEGTGEIATFQAQQLHQPEAVETLKKMSFSLRQGDQQNFQAHFADSWLLYLAAFFDKTQIEMSLSQLRQQTQITPLFAKAYLAEQDYSVRRKRLAELQALGVEDLPIDKLEFRHEGEYFFYHHPEWGMVKAERMVNFLTAWDLRQLDPTFYQQVYSSEPPAPDYHWQRFDVGLETPLLNEHVPPWVLCLQAWDLPWVESNLTILRRHQPDHEWSLWARVDSQLFAFSDYRHRLVEELGAQLGRRFRSDKISVGLPVGRHPQPRPWPLHVLPLYKNLRQQPKIKQPNYHSCGPDVVGSFSPFALYQEQKKLAQKLTVGDLL